MKRILCALALSALFVPAQWAYAGPRGVDEDVPTREEIEEIKEEIEELEDRLEKAEKHAALDRVRFSGDFRFEFHTIDGMIPDHFDGMHLQNLLVKTLFYFGGTGMPPSSIDGLEQFIRENYAQWLYFTDNLTWDQLQQAVGMFPPEAMEQLMRFLLPNTYVPGYDTDNGILYTNRLRLRIQADVASNVKFDGRLSMYKVWGDSTGVQVFNGQPNSINVDGTTVGVPNSDIIRVERAYFTWSEIGDAPIYLSIGRRPSTGGAPLNFRQDEPRGGTPLGSLINYQFDGATFGWHITDESTLRLCYGVGYESGFGNGHLLSLPADRLKDAQFFGVNWDIYDTDSMFVQATVARAFNVTDGFNGLVVLPNDPVTGSEIKAPVVLRFTPSENLGDINLASVVLIRHDGPIDWFASANYSGTDPNNVTTPFGGLMSDPFETPQSRDGGMFYGGFRYNFNEKKTKIGFEYNYGSKYWFNFAAAEDDIIAPKTNARGHVFETYFTHRIHKNFILKADYIDYRYTHSGSGWHLGAPKKLDEMPILGFPTYNDVRKFAVSLIARF